MAKFELNIYGKNDEIVNVYKTDHVRWGLLIAALDLQEQIKDADEAEQIKAISAFAKEIFVDLTDEDLNNADSGDVINVFAQVGRMANKIKGNGSKNA